jgi:hypothetical protein
MERDFEAVTGGQLMSRFDDFTKQAEEEAEPEDRTLQGDVVDDWVEVTPDTVSLRIGELLMPIASTEELSKRSLRDFAQRFRETLEEMVHEGLERLRGKISEERQREQEETAPHSQFDAEGYIVVDTTWKRSLHYSRQSWLGNASPSFPVTIFRTEKEASDAITNTKSFNESKYAWSSNDYIVLPFYQEKK